MLNLGGVLQSDLKRFKNLDSSQFYYLSATSSHNASTCTAEPIRTNCAVYSTPLDCISKKKTLGLTVPQKWCARCRYLPIVPSYRRVSTLSFAQNSNGAPPQHT